MVNYSITRIFSIRNDVNDKKFVSYTTKRLCEVFNNIRQKYKRAKTLQNPLMIAFNEIGLEHFCIVLEEQCELKNIDEVNKKVYEYILKYDSINNGYNYKRGYNKTQQEAETETDSETDIQPSDGAMGLSLLKGTMGVIPPSETPQTEPKHEPEPKPEIEPETEPELKHEPKPKPEPKPETEPVTEPKTQTESVPKHKPHVASLDKFQPLTLKKLNRLHELYIDNEISIDPTVIQQMIKIEEDLKRVKRGAR
jgi:hypothetical protein